MPVVRLEGCDYARGIGWNTEAITLRSERNPWIGRAVDPVGVNSRMIVFGVYRLRLNVISYVEMVLV